MLELKPPERGPQWKYKLTTSTAYRPSEQGPREVKTQILGLIEIFTKVNYSLETHFQSGSSPLSTIKASALAPSQKSPPI